ncbi:sulfatase [Campylobacterota bacterium]|nr:sulfatase [Campylobacterota bacterium]
MKRPRFLTKQLIVAAAAIAAIWAMLLVARAAFAIYFAPADVEASVIARAFYIGLRFDGRLATDLALPIIFFLFIPRGERLFALFAKPFAVFYAVLLLLVAIVYAGDAGHYDYLGVRVNFNALWLLSDWKEAALMVWQSYPIVWIAASLAIFAALAYALFLRLFSLGGAPQNARKRDRVSAATIAFFAAAILIYGQYPFRFMPLRWSEAYFSGNSAVAAIALNPIFNIYDTKPTRDLHIKQFDLEATKAAYPLIAEYLAIDGKNELDFKRTIAETSKDRPNVILIVCESLSLHRTSLMFDELPVTPFLVELAAKSLYFPNFYANSRTTANALFTILTGITDAQRAFASSSRDQDAIDQQVIWNALAEYNKLYFIGGNAGWANLRGVLTNNIQGLKILEEDNFKTLRTDVWGLSDLDLFKETADYLEGEKTPFFAMIQTASNHSPFTVPKGLAGFDYSKPSQSVIAEHGYPSADYKAMELMDFALRQFFERIQTMEFFENTIVVITGDHGISGEFSQHAGKNYQALEINQYQVPLIIYYPKRFPNGLRLLQAGGHTDLFPTIAALIGAPHANTTLGRDLLDDRFGDDRSVFIARTYTTPVLLSSSRLCESGGKIYAKDPADPKADWRATEQETAECQTLIDALEQTAHYLLFNNKKTSN